jgi:rod shape-determining protein MreD
VPAKSDNFIVSALRSLSPFVLVFLLLLVTRVPFRAGDMSMYVPLISLSFAFYFTLHRPRYVPIWSLFLLGLLDDFLAGGVVGLTSLILVSVPALLLNQRRFFRNRSFVVTWAGFALLCLGASAVIWLVETFRIGAPISPLPAVVQMAMTLLAYPIVSWIFGTFERAVLRP